MNSISADKSSEPQIFAAVTETDGTLAVSIHPSRVLALCSLEDEIDEYADENIRRKARDELRSFGHASVDMNLGHSFEVVQVADPSGMFQVPPSRPTLPSEVEPYAAMTESESKRAISIYPSRDAAVEALIEEARKYPREMMRRQIECDLRNFGEASDRDEGSFEAVKVNDPTGFITQALAAQAVPQRMFILPSEDGAGDMIFAVGPKLSALSDAELDRVVRDIVTYINRNDAVCEGRGEPVEDAISGSLEAMGLRRIRPRLTQIVWDAHVEPGDRENAPPRERG